jgi:Tol biopolymer transport system component
MSQELWGAADARIVGAPAISPDGQRIAFSARIGGRTALYVMRADGSDMRVVTDALLLAGSPVWTPDGRFITSAADDHGTPKLRNIPLDGSPAVPLVSEYSMDPSWSPDGTILVYSGPDIGTTFTLKAVSFGGTTVKSIRPLTLTRGARHVTYLPRRHALVVLRGEIEHKDLWIVDLDTGHEEALSHFDPDFNITDFDVSPDGREVVLERSQNSSHIALLELPRQGS